MGLERVWERFSTVLVSDASAPFKTSAGILRFRLGQLFGAMRLIDLINAQALRVRRRWLMKDLTDQTMWGAYWGIATRINKYYLEEHGLPPPLIKDSGETKSISLMRTRLNCFKSEEQERLINWGYALADAAMRRRVLDKATKPGVLPYP